MSSNSFSTLFIKKNSLWLIFESIKALEIKSYILFNLNFANNTSLSCLFFFFFDYWLILLIPAVITQMFNPIAEFTLPTGISNKDAKAEMVTHPVTVETKIIKW